MLLTYLIILTATNILAFVSSNEISSLRNELKELREQILRDKATDTYTRWGRTTCPTGATTIYVGFAAGAHYTHSGGAANYVCLSKKPTFDYHSVQPRYYTYIYGAEYETHDSIWHQFVNHDVPCVVCQVPRTSVIMVPGRNDCPDNFKLEYAGYLMAGHKSHAAASEYVCVDKDPTEDDYSNGGNADGKLFYFVRAGCGALKCLPYRRGKSITCAVCSFSP
ncbi:short-chain collagen C4-like [Ruditapes philippinarum]|uniref:short-chain collagen C4-like n=1 Tax=Ruditapes philippinarum TaxID=129788 RepID=UPI00295C0303|nr:short-chain collagen C4-like [Ruditapes philippinarum]